MLKTISNIFKSIFKFFDKHVVVPITKLILKLSGKFETSGKLFENFLAKQTTLLFLSLFLAVTIFIVVDQKIIVFSSSSAEVFKGVTINTDYAEERFVIEGLPENVDVTLIGSKADLYIAEQLSSHNILVDLNYIKEPGTYTVDLEYNQGLSSVEYSVNPSQVRINVYLRESENRDLAYNIVNSDNLDSTLDINSVELNVDQVTISGADYKLAKVATVDALIDVDKLTSTTEGIQTLEDITLRAYDKDGNVVDVDISTTTKVTANVEIISSSREINLNFVPVNNVPFGKAISAYAFSQNTVLVYGSKEVLDSLEKTGIDIEIDVSKLTENYSADVEIPKPTGIKKLGTNKVNVDVAVTDVAEPKSITLKIDALNAGSGLTAGANSADDAQVLVEIKGAQNILDEIAPADYQAFVDLTGYEAGIWEVPIEIKANTANARLTSPVAKKATVTIKLTKNN